MKLTEKEENIYNNLKNQVDSIYKHIRNGSYGTRRRYYAAMLRFLRFLATEYRLENIRNIGPKHLIGYVEYIESMDLSERTIKTDLSAIRWFHDFVPRAKYMLPDNDHLGVELPKHVFQAEDRTWSDKEYADMCQIAISEGIKAYANAITLARFAGLRIHEVFRIDAATAHAALKSGNLFVKGKNGKDRIVPASEECLEALADQLSVTDRGEKLFVGHGEDTDRAINRLQIYLWRHRDEVRDPNNPIKLTFHGLRHTYAAEQYRTLREQGVSLLDAYLHVSKLLGHNRGGVTRVYTGSVDESLF